ncbi:MAG: pyridoxal phosphate-dependent aminotransferase, partial [Anaerotignaceae bacterium]
MNTLVHQHGGDLNAIERTYNIPKDEIIDFSGNVNPLGFPKTVTELLKNNLHLVCRYPDKNYINLKNSIAKYTGTVAENIAVGNGSTELISCFIAAVNPKKAIILGPAYSEYEHKLTTIKSQFAYFPLKEENNFLIEIDKLKEVLTPDVDLFVACNPNNPTGTAITTAQLEEILIHCTAKQISVMIDETYIEFSENLDEICAIPLTEKYENLFVIRGIAKFFAAPGLRLGYGITKNSTFKDLLHKTQDPWSVNILATFAGEVLFDDLDFIAQTKELIATEREKALDQFKTFKNIKAY